MRSKLRRRLSSFQLILLSFALLILLGAGLLCLPCAVRPGQSVCFREALFTAVSAVCVTGLAVRDTATCWSGFGQAVLLMLIQVGGLGVVTVALGMAVLSGRRIGLMQRGVMQEAIGAPQLGGIVPITLFILRAALLMELLGVAALYPVFSRTVGPWRGIWYALFHAVSAFCNAGFDLMGGASLAEFAGSPGVNLTVSALILAGGLGFFTWEDIRRHGLHLHHYRMQSKAVLAFSLPLILLPLCFFYGYEFARPVWGELAAGRRFWLALFQTVTPRTAGFCTADLTQMSEAGQTVLLLLMLVGGASGSTAGGMKITTLAVLAASARAVFLRNTEAHLFRRRIPQETVRSAAAIALLYAAMLLGGGLVLCCRSGLPLGTCLFEAASALCTVGLSLGATAKFDGLCQGLLMALMYLGRVGGLTLVYAALTPTESTAARYPQEKITVG